MQVRNNFQTHMRTLLVFPCSVDLDVMIISLICASVFDNTFNG